MEPRLYFCLTISTAAHVLVMRTINITYLLTHLLTYLLTNILIQGEQKQNEFPQKSYQTLAATN